jgi:hypothetical protein
MGIENGFKLDEFTEIFLCIRSKRMNGEKPSKIKTIKWNRLLAPNKNYLFYPIKYALFRIVKNNKVLLTQIGY